MRLFSVDYTPLEQLTKRTYKLSEVKDRLVRRAADLVSFRDAPKNELWEVQSDADGEYIVARYEPEESEELPVKEASTRSLWQAQADGNKVSLFYKGAQFAKFPHPNADTVKDFLPAKLAADKSFLSALLKTFSKERQVEVQNLYPELF